MHIFSMRNKTVSRMRFVAYNAQDDLFALSCDPQYFPDPFPPNSSVLDTYSNVSNAKASPLDPCGRPPDPRSNGHRPSAAQSAWKFCWCHHHHFQLDCHCYQLHRRHRLRPPLVAPTRLLKLVGQSVWVNHKALLHRLVTVPRPLWIKQSFIFPQRIISLAPRVSQYLFKRRFHMFPVLLCISGDKVDFIVQGKTREMFGKGGVYFRVF